MHRHARPALPGFRRRSSTSTCRSRCPTLTFAELERAFYAGQVLVLRGQSLTPAQFVAFARRLGRPAARDRPVSPSGRSNILILSNVKKDGKPTGLQDAGSYFHTDYSYLQVPARATTLYSIVVPKVGGDTLFANQQAAYDDLSDAMKKRIEPLYGIHHYGNRNDTDEQSRTVGLAAHRRTEGEDAADHASDRAAASGDRAQSAVRGQSGSSFGIVGMPDDEARDLLDELAAHSTQPKYRTASSTASATS